MIQLFMEKKQLTTRQWATIKRIAQNTLPAIQRAERLKKYVEEYEDLLAQIEADNSAAMRMSGGYTASELILREVVDYVDKQTGEVKVDKDGRALKLTKWVPNKIYTYNIAINPMGREILLHLSSFEVKYFSRADLADVYKVPAVASENPLRIIPEFLSALLTDMKTLVEGLLKIRSGFTYDTEETYAVDVLRTGVRRLVRPAIRYARNPEPYTRKVTLLHYERNLKRLFVKEPAEDYPAYELNLETLQKIRDLCKESGVTLKVVIGASFLSERYDYECEKY